MESRDHDKKTGRSRKARGVGKTYYKSKMPKFIIEREIPNAGSLTPEQLKGVSQTSCGVLKSMGPEIIWVQSYVTDNKVFCVYIAPNEEMIREHGRQGDIPVNSIHRVSTIIDATTAE